MTLLQIYSKCRCLWRSPGDSLRLHTSWSRSQPLQGPRMSAQPPTARPCNSQGNGSEVLLFLIFFFSFLTARKFVSQPSHLREQEWQRQEKGGFGIALSRLFILGRAQTLDNFRGDSTYHSISSFFPWIRTLRGERLRVQAMADEENVSFQKVKGKDSPFSPALVHSELSVSPNYCWFKLYRETHPVL